MLGKQAVSAVDTSAYHSNDNTEVVISHLSLVTVARVGGVGLASTSTELLKHDFEHNYSLSKCRETLMKKTCKSEALTTSIKDKLIV